MIYTKSGDKGETSLFNGSRVSKFDSRIRLLGAIDEANSFIGLLVSSLDESNSLYDDLHMLQSLIFDIGSEIANPNITKDEYKDYDVFVKFLENNIDEIDKNLDKLTNFILPGGSTSSSYAHICRTKVRSCERMFFKLSNELEFNESIGRFLNRLSDYFFVLARKLNQDDGVEDIIWKAVK